jgi:glycosyltransferase involved in cell wall biosynthesis
MACPSASATEEFTHDIGLQTVPFNLEKSNDMKEAWALACAIRQYNVDIVHVHARRDFFPSIAALIMNGVLRLSFAKRPRLILHCHQTSNLARPSLATKLLFTLFTDRVYAVSNAVIDRLNARDLIVPSSKIKLFYNGISANDYIISHEKAENYRAYYREIWGVPTEASVIATIGRIYDKGQEILLRLMPRLLQIIPDLKYIAIGPDKDAVDTVEKFRNEVKERNLFDSVIVPGPATHNVPQILTAIDCIVQLPVFEAFGLVLIEAGAAGLPVIASNIGGCPEVVEDNVSGIVINLSDDEAIIAAIAKMFDPVDGKKLREKFGKAGREKATNRFSINENIQYLVSEYSDLCKK